MRETFGTCDGCGRADTIVAYLMDDGAVWPLCPDCASIGLREGTALYAVLPVAWSGERVPVSVTVPAVH